MDDSMVLVHEDSLAHYGVPGMRWGKRRGSSDSSGSAGSAKPLSKSKQRTQMIKDARNNLDDSYNEANRAAQKYNSAKTERARKMAEKTLEKASDVYMTNVARSMQKTRGEKIKNGIVTGITVTALVGSYTGALGRR